MKAEPVAASDTKLIFGTSETGRSCLANELRRLPERLRKALELRDWVIDSVDALVSALVVVADPTDTRAISERLNSLLGEHRDVDGGSSSKEFDRELSEWTERLNALSETELPRWTKRIAGDGSWRRFARRLIGAREYDRLTRALQDDLSAIAGGFRRIVQIAQPFAVAFDDVVSILTADQIKAIDSTYDWAAISALKFLLQLDSAIGRYVDSRFDWSSLQLDLMADDGPDFAEVAQHLRGLAAGPTRERLNELNARLAAKISGAQDALWSSADGVSQASHSLVELIDRMLRTAFPDDVVLSWVADSARTEDGLTYVAADLSRRPTKRAQALCFAYGGRSTDQRSAIHEMVATGLVSARSQLQALKHADEGTESEVARVVALMAAVEGFLTLALRLGWAPLNEAEVDCLRHRLAS